LKSKTKKNHELFLFFFILWRLHQNHTSEGVKEAAFSPTIEQV